MRPDRDLDTACAEAAAPNWDGYGALPVEGNTYELAKSFLRALPRLLPDPDIAVDPDGEVTFRWICAAREVVAASLRGDGRLSVAAILGDKELHVTERFFGQQIPKEFAAQLDRLFA